MCCGGVGVVAVVFTDNITSLGLNYVTLGCGKTAVKSGHFVLPGTPKGSTHTLLSPKSVLGFLEVTHKLVWGRWVKYG